MLFGQERRRYQDGDLATVDDRLEGRSDGDLGLAVPDVAGDQAVHGAWLLHVSLDFLDGAQLVTRLLVREGFFQLGLPWRIGAEGVARHAHPDRVQPDQLARHVPDGAADPALGPDPVVRSEPVHPRRLTTDILGHHADLVGGHVQLVARPVLQEEVVALGAGDGAPHHPQIAAHPVNLVDGEVAGRELHGRPVGAAAGQARRQASVASPPEQVFFGQHGEPWPRRVLGLEPEPLFDVGLDRRRVVGAESLGGEDLLGPVQAPPPLGDQDDVRTAGSELGRPFGHAVRLAGPLPRKDAEVDRAGRRQLGEVDPRPGGERDVRFPDRRGTRPRGRMGQRVGLLGDPASALEGPVRRRQDDQPAAGQQIGQDGQPIVEERDGLLHALERKSFGQPLQQRKVLALVAGQRGDGSAADVVGGEELPGRMDLHRIDRAGGELRGRGELPERLDILAEELHSNGPAHRRRKHVHDAAADRELAALLHHVHPRVGQLDEPLDQPVEVALLAGLQVDRGQLAEPGRHRLDQAAHGRDHDPWRVRPAQPVQHVEPATDGVRAGRQAFVRQRLPGREVGDLVAAEQARQRGGQLVGLAAGGGDGQHRAPGTGRERRHDELSARTGASRMWARTAATNPWPGIGTSATRMGPGPASRRWNGRVAAASSRISVVSINPPQDALAGSCDRARETGDSTKRPRPKDRAPHLHSTFRRVP